MCRGDGVAKRRVCWLSEIFIEILKKNVPTVAPKMTKVLICISKSFLWLHMGRVVKTFFLCVCNFVFIRKRANKRERFEVFS